MQLRSNNMRLNITHTNKAFTVSRLGEAIYDEVGE